MIRSDILRPSFSERYDEVVLLRDIEFHSLCEHHLLPFTGQAHVAYLPDGKVVGLSKLARLVEGLRTAAASSGTADDADR